MMQVSYLNSYGKVGETGDEKYTGELLQSSMCQAGTSEGSLTTIDLFRGVGHVCLNLRFRQIFS